MEGKEFPQGTKARDIFVYTCQRIAEPLLPLGFKYRKSKNDIYKKDGAFVYRIWFQPWIQFGSTIFSVHIAVESESLARWRRQKYGDANENGLVLSATLASLTKRAQAWPDYEVATLLERERVIAEITEQALAFAIPFFQRFSDLKRMVEEVRAHGFLPHRKQRRGRSEREETADFIECFEKGLV